MAIPNLITYILDNARQRIIYFLKSQGIKPKDFLEKTGLKKGIIDRSHEKSGVSDIHLSKILDSYPELSAYWLLSGKGDMINYTEEGQEKIETVQAYATDSTENAIPLVLVTAVGGFGNSNFMIAEKDIKEHYVIPKFKDQNIDFMIEVSGTSMYPHFNSGDVVACSVIRESSVIQWNKVYVVATEENGILIKRVRQAENDSELLMVSENSDYAPFALPKSEITGLALVVGTIRLE